MENETLKFDWEYFIKEDLEQLNAEKSPDIYGSIIVTRGKKIFIVDVQWETVSSYGRRGISLNVYRSNEDHLHCDWIEDIKEIVTATNYKHFQHRAEKLITELIASVEKEPIVNAETYTTPAAGSIGTAKVGEKVICYDEYLHDYVEHTMLVRTIEKDPEMKTETNPEGVVLYGIDLSDDNDESMICTVSEGNYVCSAGVATVDELMKVERNEAYDRFAKEMKGLLPCFVSRDCSEIEYEVDFALYGLREKIDTIVENLKTENFSDNGKPDGTSGIYQLVRPSIETIIDYCNDLAADEKLEVFEFGEDCDLVLHIYKDEEYDASKDKDSYNIVSISTARNGEWVDDTDDVYVTDGSLANELDRIYRYRKFATK